MVSSHSVIRRSILVAGIVLLLAACGRSDGKVEVRDGRVVRPPPGAAMAAGYFTLVNGTNHPVQLTAVQSSAFGAVEIHETTEENGLMKMRRVDRIPVPAHESVTFAPGGKHLMMFRPVQPLEGLTSVPITVEIAGPGGEVSKLDASMPVQAP